MRLNRESSLPSFCIFVFAIQGSNSEEHSFMKQSSSKQVDRGYFLVHLYSAIVDVLVNRTLGKKLTDLYTTNPNVRARDVAASLGLAVTESGAITGLQVDSLTLEQAIKDKKRKSGITGPEIEELMAKVKLNFSDPTTFEVRPEFRTPRSIFLPQANNSTDTEIFLFPLTPSSARPNSQQRLE
jgi:hypothetical protein